MVEDSQNYADIRLLSGDQGSGKTGTTVALVIDDYFAHLTGLRTPLGNVIKASPVTQKEDEMLSYIHDEATDIPLRFMRVYSPDGKNSKIIEKPKGWIVESPIKVFSNFHFYGIRFVFIDGEFIIEHMNDGLMTDAWVVIDESIITEKRDTMSDVGKMVAWFGAQARRRNLHMACISQYLDMQQSRFVRFATTKVLCTYNTQTQMVELDVNRTSEVMRSTTYKLSDYFRFYKHDERVPVPQYRINRVLARMHEEY